MSAVLAVTALSLGIAAPAAAAKPAAKAATLVTCTLSGSTTFAEVGNTSNGITSLVQRDIKITGQNTAICVDARLNKSLTGGRTITGFTAKTTGSFTHSTCLVASGFVDVTITWYLNTGSNLTSVIHNNFLLANILEALPGTGTVASGLFAGATAETNSVFTGATNDVKCLSDEGITNTTRTTTLAIAG